MRRGLCKGGPQGGSPRHGTGSQADSGSAARRAMRSTTSGGRSPSRGGPSELPPLTLAASSSVRMAALALSAQWWWLSGLQRPPCAANSSLRGQGETSGQSRERWLAAGSASHCPAPPSAPLRRAAVEVGFGRGQAPRRGAGGLVEVKGVQHRQHAVGLRGPQEARQARVAVDGGAEARGAQRLEGGGRRALPAVAPGWGPAWAGQGAVAGRQGGAEWAPGLRWGGAGLPRAGGGAAGGVGRWAAAPPLRTACGACWAAG